MVSLLPEGVAAPLRRSGATSGALALFSLGVMTAPSLASSFHASAAAFATPPSALKPLSAMRKGLCFGTNAGVLRSVKLPSRPARAMAMTAAADRVVKNGMTYNRLGDSDLMVSRCCLGTMTWGKQNSAEEGCAQMDMAFDEFGVNFIDTAEMYPVPAAEDTQGATDRVIAKWLPRRKREEVILASKVAGYSAKATYYPGRNGQPSRLTPEEIVGSVEASLERLGTEYIDLLQIHWPARYVPLFGENMYKRAREAEWEAVPVKDQLGAFKELVDRGKVRYVGLSNETPFGVMEFCKVAEQHALPKVVSVQNVYSLLNRIDFDAGLNEVCSPRNCNVGLLAYSALGGGALSGKYARYARQRTRGEEEEAAEWRMNKFKGFFARYLNSASSEAVERYAAVAAQHGLTPAELALAWCDSRDYVASTIVGATSLTQLRENIGAFLPAKRLPPEAEPQIEEIFRLYTDPTKTLDPTFR